MYDRLELREQTDALWAFIRDHLRSAGVAEVPDALSRPDDHTVIWRDERLLFTQTCGWDLRHRYAGQHRMLRAPLSTALGCAGPTYSSFLMVRRGDEARDVGDLAGRRAAINELPSLSGRVALERLVTPHAEGGRFFSRVIATGAHEKSAEAIVTGEADVASIDCHTYALMAACRPALADGLRTIGRSPQAPSPPFVAGPAATDAAVEALTSALDAIATAPALADVRAALLLDGTDDVPPDTYARASFLRSEDPDRPYRVSDDGLETAAPTPG